MNVTCSIAHREAQHLVTGSEYVMRLQERQLGHWREGGGEGEGPLSGPWWSHLPLLLTMVTLTHLFVPAITLARVSSSLASTPRQRVKFLLMPLM